MAGFTDALRESLQGVLDAIAAAGPRLLAAVIILLVGWIASKLVKVAVTKGLKAVKLDVAAEKTGVETFLQRGNIRSSSVEIIGKLIYWLLLLLTLLLAVRAMGLPEAQLLFASVLAILPRVVLAVFVLILGLTLAGFIADIVQTAAANAQSRHARLLSNISRYSITILVVIVALNQLDIATDVISTAFLILFGALCLAGALAFGLGCRNLAASIAEDAWEREQAASKALADAAEEPEA